MSLLCDTAPSIARLDSTKIDLMQGQLAQKHFEQHLPSAAAPSEPQTSPATPAPSSKSSMAIITNYAAIASTVKAAQGCI